MDWVQKEGKSAPTELQEVYRGLEESYKKRLWDNMSNQLLALSTQPGFAEPGAGRLSRLYENFVKKFEAKINQIRFVQFACAVASAETDRKAGVVFLEGVKKIVAADKQASLLASLEILRRQIQMTRYDEVKVGLEEAKSTLDGSAGSSIMEPLIYSIYHLTALEYHKAMNNAQEFFNNSLLYLTYTPLSSIPHLQQVALAADVGLAALVGRNTYNFGELVQHPILKVLTGTPSEWIAHMLDAFNSGNIKKFREIYSSEAKTPVLAENEQFLNEKIRIMAFMEMVFRRDSKDRKISFAEVGRGCDIKESEVELLLMKAFSLKVVKGLIDEVDRSVRVRWVQPRVLDMKQIEFLRDQLKIWATKVNTTALYVQQNAPEIVP